MQQQEQVVEKPKAVKRGREGGRGGLGVEGGIDMAIQRSYIARAILILH